MLQRFRPRSRSFLLFCYTMFGGLCETHQPDTSPNPSLRVAIVGAGVAGASAAFYLKELSHSAPISITVYESEPNVGGRVASVSVQEFPPKIVEAGSPLFFTDDDCLTRGIESTGLTFPNLDPLDLPESIGLWNGKDITAGTYCNMEPPTWRKLTRFIARYGILAWRLDSHTWFYLPQLITRYGMSAWRFHRALVYISKRWKMLGTMRPFDDFGQALKDSDLSDDLVYGSAHDYLRKLDISPRFLSEVVEPCTRARFSQNLENLSAFSALMAMRRAKAGPIGEGNSRLIEQMIVLSGAELRLNSTAIEIKNGNTGPYQLSVTSTSPGNPPTVGHTEYDIIILAVPIHDEAIKLNILGYSTKKLIAPQSFAQFYVTHFSTSRTISSSFFHSALNLSIPDNLLTTAQSLDILSTTRSHVCYYRGGCLPGDECDQCDDDDNMYRVVSRALLSDIDLVRLIGERRREGQSLADMGITWVHRQAWWQAQPTFCVDRQDRKIGNLQIAPGLFHLGGLARMLDSMEMSCRMGRNVARLLTGQGVHDLNVAHPEL